MSQVTIDRIAVRFGSGPEAVHALQEFSLTLEAGEFVVLLGPSGCGKSTVLNSVAGLVQPDEGSISIDGSPVFSSGRSAVNLPSEKRNLGMVFQAYSLWPHMTVRENVGFPLKARRVPRPDRGPKVDEALGRVQVQALADRYPGELSGGQQQRVALARAIVSENAVLLFDEPLSNLDARLRQELRDEIRALHQRLGFTGLYVTHDQAEALTLASRVVVMRAGRIEQMGTPEELYRAPANAYVARFLGANVIAGTGVVEGGGTDVKTAFGTIRVEGERVAGPLSVAFYPQDAVVERVPDGPATVLLDKFAGRSRELTLISGAERVDVASSAFEPHDPGERVRLRVAGAGPFLYPAELASDEHLADPEIQVPVTL